MFLTLEDPRAKVQGSCDPLGIQPIWARFGREVVTNLTTVSRAVRGFTVMLLGRYYGERLLDEGQAGEEDAISIFLRLEQIAAYARYVRRREEQHDIVLGITRVARFLDEYQGRVPIRADATGSILSDQKLYGLWGLYAAPARVSGLLADGPVGLSQEARDFVERTYIPRLHQVHAKLCKLVLDGGKLDTRKGQEPFESTAKILTGRFSEAECVFYGETLRDARMVGRTSAAERQRQLASLVRRTCQPGGITGREEVQHLVRAAQHAGDTSLAERLNCILRLEATLAPAEALFNHILARNGQAPATIASHLRDHWGAQVPHLSDSIESLLPDIQQSAGEDQIQSLRRCDDALAHGAYEEAIQALLEWNGTVMTARGSAPWVQLTSGGKIDVKYRHNEDMLPAGDELPLLWRNSYFLDTLKTITFQLENAT